MKKYTLKDIEPFIGNYKIIGGEFLFEKVSTIEDADERSLIWISPSKEDFNLIISLTLSKVIICSKDTENLFENIKDKTVIFVDNPRLVFLRICKGLFSPEVDFSIHNTTIIHPEANISKRVHIGPNCYIGKCIILEGTIIIGNSYINDNVVLGKNVQIGTNCSIGLDGFGYQKNENDEWEKFPHIGGVIIEDNVEIGSNTCIDRGTIGNTIIKKGAKIDNLVHIAHNVVIGENSMIIANSMIGGSTEIGNNVWIAPSSSIKDGIIIENDALVGLGATILKSIPNGERWVGNPGRKI